MQIFAFSIQFFCDGDPLGDLTINGNSGVIGLTNIVTDVYEGKVLGYTSNLEAPINTDATAFLFQAASDTLLTCQELCIDSQSPLLLTFEENETVFDDSTTAAVPTIAPPCITSAPPPPQSALKDEEGDNSSGLKITLIVLGSVIGFVCVVALLLLVRRKHRDGFVAKSVQLRSLSGNVLSEEDISYEDPDDDEEAGGRLPMSGQPGDLPSDNDKVTANVDYTNGGYGLSEGDAPGNEELQGAARPFFLSDT